MVRTQELTAARKMWNIEVVSYRDVNCSSFSAVTKSNSGKTTVVRVNLPTAGNISDCRIIDIVRWSATGASGSIAEKLSASQRNSLSRLQIHVLIVPRNFHQSMAI